jgi:arylsulfatase A
MIRWILAPLAALVAASVPAAPLCAADVNPPPNVIFILADDLGCGELGCYGQKLIHTPHIDQLAAEGMRFTQCYSGNAVCAPSRCCLMTGKHPGHATIRDNRELKQSVRDARKRASDDYWPGQWPLPDNEITIAELLRRRGYATAAVGKWGLGNVGNSGDPLRQGFDLFYGFYCQADAHNHYPRYLWRNGVREPQPGNTRSATGETYAEDQFARLALDFIRNNKDRPFFLYLPVTIPHLAIQVPEKSLDEYCGKIPEADYKYTGAYEEHPTPRAGYAAMVSHLDRDVGRVMALLKELRLDDTTLVFFSSDNGPTYGRLAGADSDFFHSSGPLRGRKASLYEGGIRVPMIARWPGKIKPGTTTDHVAAFWDVLPTLADVAGAAAPPSIDGISFAPTLLGRPDEQKDHPWLYWEFHGYGGWQAVRLGDWKAVRHDILRWKKPGLPPLELYNLAADLGERHNIATEHPDVVRRIKKIMREEHTPSEAFPIAPPDDQ